MIEIKKKLIILLIFLIVIGIVTVASLYISQKKFRDWIDVNILRKNITEEELPTINLNTDKQNQIYVYSKYIGILNENTIRLYNNYGEEITSINVDINNAIFDTKGKYLAVAEDGGNNLCLILEKDYLWGSTIEGKILQIHVNKNGYVAVITSDSTHKSIVTLFNPSGKKLFKSYFSSTRIVDASISEDNKYIAIGELDTTGSIIQSNIKIISIENAQKDYENAIIYTYTAENDNLIINVEYQSKGQIVCKYDKCIHIIKDNESKEFFRINDDTITFIENNLSKDIAYVKEETSSLFKKSSKIMIVSTYENSENENIINDVVKDFMAKDDVLAVNTGNEAYFFGTNGWLLKKYEAKQEITNIDFSSSVAAIIYKNKIIVVTL